MTASPQNLMRRGSVVALEELVESFDLGEIPTFTVASWVTRSNAEIGHSDEERLRPVRAVRVDDLTVFLNEVVRTVKARMEES